MSLVYETDDNDVEISITIDREDYKTINEAAKALGFKNTESFAVLALKMQILGICFCKTEISVAEIIELEKKNSK